MGKEGEEKKEDVRKVDRGSEGMLKGKVGKCVREGEGNKSRKEKEICAGRGSK